MGAQRVDALLVARGLCDSREQAKRLIMAGEVMTGTVRVAKASQKLAEDAPLSVKEKPKFVGRGGFKIEGALEEFEIEVEGLVCAGGLDWGVYGCYRGGRSGCMRLMWGPISWCGSCGVMSE